MREAGEQDGQVSVRIETTAGLRTLFCAGVEIRDGRAAV
jgi:hypothetical protein